MVIARVVVQLTFCRNILRVQNCGVCLRLSLQLLSLPVI